MALTTCLVIALQSLAPAASADVPSPARVEREAWVMGTRFRLVVEAPEEKAARAAAEEALREVERLERLLSTWDTATELSRLNRTPPGQPLPLSGELRALLAEARGWASRTDGAFEPVVGALVEAWELRGEGRVPTEDELRRARAATGPGGLQLLPAGSSDAPGVPGTGAEGRPAAPAETDWTPTAAVRHHPDAWIDAGGFGKGAALRSAGGLLREANVERALLDLGGQLWVEASAEEPWEVPVAHPARRDESAVTLRLHAVSVATSGTSERSLEVAGRRVGHILDPRTGRPAPAWGTVTVVHPDPFAADVLSTALYVMGPQAGRRWAIRNEVAALFQEVQEDGAVLAHWTGAMAPWIAEAAAREGGAAAHTNQTHHPEQGS